MWIFAGHAQGDLVGVRFSHEDGACLPELVYNESIRVGNIIWKERRANGSADPGHVEEVFQGYRDST